MERPIYLKLHPSDNVLVLVRAVRASERIDIGGQQIVFQTDIPMGHKIAERPIAPGDQIVKYGVPIGTATAPINVGDHVHLHNVKSNYMPTFGNSRVTCDAQ